MHADDFDELAGRIEGLARTVLHLAARLEDSGVIDGPALAEGLRGGIVLTDGAGVLMTTAKRTMDNAANTLDEARRWRRFRQQVTAQLEPMSKRRSA